MTKCRKCEVNDTLVSFEKCTQCIQKALDKPDVILNDVLAYVNSYRGSSEKSNLLNVCLKHFNDEDITNAKTAIYEEHSSILGEQPRRVGGAKNSKKELSIEDIYDAFLTLDDKSITVICASINIKSIPKFNPEELDHSSMLERILKLENSVLDHNNRLDENYARITENKNQIEATNKAITHVKDEVETSLTLANESKEDVIQHNKVESEVK